MTEHVRKILGNVWLRAAAKLALVVAYVPSLVIPPFVVDRILRRAADGPVKLALASYTFASYVAVCFCLLVMLGGGHLRAPRLERFALIFLVLDWLPHTVIAGLWTMALSPGGWVH